MPLYSYGIREGYHNFSKSSKTIRLLKFHSKNIRVLSQIGDFDELARELFSFKSFVEKETGSQITLEMMYDATLSRLRESNLSIDVFEIDKIFSLLKRYEENIHNPLAVKSVYQQGHDKIETELPAGAVIGLVLVACASLPTAIGVVCPPAAPVCFSLAEIMASTGAGLFFSSISAKN